MTPGRLLAPLVAAVLALASLVDVLVTTDWTGPRLAALVAAVLIPAPIAWARTRPLAAGLGVCAAIVATALLLRSPQSLVVILTLLVAGFVIGFGGRRGRWAAGGAVLATAVVAIARSRDGGFPPSVIAWVFSVLLYAAPVALGAVVRARTDAARAARDDADRAESEQRLAAALAVRDERDRIARDLREVVTTAVTRIVAAADAGRGVVTTDPGAAADAFETIEVAGQQALMEMRRLLGVLRAVPGPAALAPQPRLADLEQLLAATAATGVVPTIRLEGVPRELPETIELCAYRLIESALEDASVRFGPGPVEVAVEHLDAGLRVALSTERVPAETSDVERARLDAMRERTALCGGRLTAGSTAAGYRLEALLPVAVA